MKKTAVFSIAAFLLGCGGTYLYMHYKSNSDLNIIRVNSPEYHFINPLLLIDNSHVDFPELDGLKNDIEKTINSAKDSGEVNNAAFYFRDLNSSKWTGFNESDLYSPSSMLKVVTLLAYLKAAESDPTILTQRVYFVDKPDTGQHYAPQEYLSPGMYSVRELLVQMIVNSDNSAMQTLNGLHPDQVYQVYQALQLPDPRLEADDFMSAEMYSRVWRSLYSSTYLSHQSSEEALKLLSYTTFNAGLVAGVASSTVVSHKFGEHTLLDSYGKPIENQLHDCGIIYYPQKPYLLCVMTRGESFPSLENFIKTVSTIVYSRVSKQ